MTHYTVCVIGEDIENQLAPFDETLEMPEYISDVISDEDKKSFIDCYTIYDSNKSYGIKSQEEASINLELSFEELYSKFGKDWNSNSWRKNQDGTWCEYSTYNPKSKWDWYAVGGRWAGSLKLKENSDGELEKPKLNRICPSIDIEKSKTYKKNLKERKVDSALKKDIDFSIDEEQYKEALRFWELYIDKQEPITEEDRELIKWAYYKESYLKERYGNKETYAKFIASFNTCAVLKDGAWYEAGETGWFGSSSASPTEKGKFERSLYDKFISDLPEDTRITIVDCHI